MYWSFVVVHILIISIISYDSFPIDLVEIHHDDIDLVDKQRKGRFIEVNQTTFLPNSNSIELIREKKSSIINKKPSDGEEVVFNNNVIKKEVETAAKQKKVDNQKPLNKDVMTTDNNYTCTDSLFEPQTFGYSSLMEDQFMAFNQPYFSDSMPQMVTNDNCFHFDNCVETFSKDFNCIDEFVDPNEISFC